MGSDFAAHLLAMAHGVHGFGAHGFALQAALGAAHLCVAGGLLDVLHLSIDLTHKLLIQNEN